MGERVLHLITWLNRGGVECWLMSMLRHIDRSRYAMDFCCKGPVVGEMASEAEALGASVIHCPLDATHVRFGRTLSRTIRKGEYDIVHNHLGAYSGYAVHVSRRTRAATVASFHNTVLGPQSRLLNLPIIRAMRNAYGRISIRYAVRNSGLITGCSRAVLDSLQEAVGIQILRTRVLYYGVSIPEVATPATKDSFRHELGFGADDPLVVHVGSFQPQKNHSSLLRIALLVLRRVPKARFVLVGGGPLRRQIKKQVHMMGLTEHVGFLGLRNDVPRVLSCSDVFLFPSLWEGFGLAALEASAAGLPVVASRIPGILEAVGSRESAILCRPSDENGFAQAVSGLLLDPELRRMIGSKGRRRAARFFSVRRSAEDLQRLYDECIRHT